MIDRGTVSIAVTSDLPGEVEVRRSHRMGGSHLYIHSVMTFTPEEAVRVRDGLDHYIKIGAEEQRKFEDLLPEIEEKLKR